MLKINLKIYFKLQTLFSQLKLLFMLMFFVHVQTKICVFDLKNLFSIARFNIKTNIFSNINKSKNKSFWKVLSSDLPCLCLSDLSIGYFSSWYKIFVAGQLNKKIWTILQMHPRSLKKHQCNRNQVT